MKTKHYLLLTVFFLSICTIDASSQITRKQADTIVFNHLQSEGIQHGLLYVDINVPSIEGRSITTSNGETVRTKYACWVYCLNENPDSTGPSQRRYLFVKEDNGSLLELISNNDLGPDNLTLWEVVAIPLGFPVREINNIKSPYPNPVDDWLTVSCTGDFTGVEIYDLNGVRLFAGLVSDKEGCRINVSFLPAGTYLIIVAGETYKIIKN